MMADQMGIALGLVILALALWNIFTSLLAVINQRLKTHRLVNATIDLVAALTIYFLTGGISSAIPWVGLLAFFTVGVYYGAFATIITGIVLTVLQAMIMAVLGPLTGVFLALSVVAIFNMAGSIVLGFFGYKLIGRLRSIYRTQVLQREEIERRARKQEHDRMEAFYELTSTLSATLNYQKVLNTALDLGAKAMDENEETASKIVSAFLLFEDNQLKVGSSRRMGPADQRVILPAVYGAVDRAVKSAEPQLIQEPATDPELGRFVALHNCSSCVCLALRSGVNVFGIFLFAHPSLDYFTKERLEVLVIMARQATVAIQNAILYRDLALEQQRIVETQEEARKKLARDLHDGPTQSVAAIAMRLNFARRLLDKDRAAAIDEMDKIEDLARRTTKEIRHMLFTLRPLVLESQGLVAAFEAMSEKMKETYNQNVMIDVNKDVINQLEIGKQTVIFYIAEEAINNARKHAQAAHILLHLGLVLT
jgi:signal transduction histidine kinase